jgi:hypothetical protein
MKRGKLSKVELEYIENNHQSVGVGDIAKNLDRTVDCIKKVIEQFPQAEKKQESTTEVFENGRVRSLMGRRVINGKVAATVMTEAASEYADEERKKTVTTRHTENAICKPLGDVKFNDDGSIANR